MAYSDHISLKLEKKTVENDIDKEDHNPDYLLYLLDISYFSGKLESYFRYQDLGFARVEPKISELGDIKKLTGTSQVPLVFDNVNKTWLRDTTYIIQHFEDEGKCNRSLQHTTLHKY